MLVLLGQLAPVPGDVAANKQQIIDALEAYPKAGMAVFPELFLSGYFDGRDQHAALSPDGPVFAELCAVAKRQGTAIITGFSEQRGNGLSNSVAHIASDGELVSLYRKVQLFGQGEMDSFIQGESLTIADSQGIKAGLLNCFDVEFPEHARQLSKNGAQLLVTIAANMAPYGPDHALSARSRAVENRRPHVYVNRVGVEGDLQFVGESCAVSPNGTVIQQLDGLAQLSAVEVDLSPWIDVDVDYLRQVRNVGVGDGLFSEAFE